MMMVQDGGACQGERDAFCGERHGSGAVVNVNLQYRTSCRLGGHPEGNGRP